MLGPACDDVRFSLPCALNRSSRDFASRYAAAWWRQNPAAVAQFFAANALLTMKGGAPAVGRAAVTSAAREFTRDFPGLCITIDRLIPQGESRVSLDARRPKYWPSPGGQSVGSAFADLVVTPGFCVLCAPALPESPASSVGSPRLDSVHRLMRVSASVLAAPDMQTICSSQHPTFLDRLIRQSAIRKTVTWVRKSANNSKNSESWVF
jgi:SnoaL-like domain